MMLINNAKWIMDKTFHGIKPINYPDKESEVDKKDLPRKDQRFLNHHMFFRKKFSILEEDIDDAVINISADDYYKLYINGEFVTQGPAPAYYFHYNYNTINIGKYLKEGVNVIAVHVFYQGLFNRVWTSGDYRQGLIANIVSNDKVVAKTDESFKSFICKAWGYNKIIAYDTQFMENIDARYLPKDWKNISFDDSSWDDAFVNINDDHILFPQLTKNISVYRIRPKILKKLDDGYYFADVGHEVTGQIAFKVKGNSGQSVKVRFGEELDSDNNVRYLMRCNCEYEEFYTLSGDIDEVEFYDYVAFRYFEIIAPKDAIVESVEVIVRHAAMDDNCYTIDSSSEILNNVFKICKAGVKFGSQEGYLDCPTREKGQYLGDGLITAKSHMLLTNDSSMYKKFLYDFAYSTRTCSGMLCVVPASRGCECADYSCQYAEHLINYYNYTCDIETLKELYPVAKGVEEWFDNHASEDLLVNKIKEKSNLVDWPKNLRDDYDFDDSKPIGDCVHSVINAFYYGMKKDMNIIRGILGIEITDNLEELKDSFISAFYNKETKLFIDSVGSKHSSLHANVLPLYYGITPKDSINETVNLIRKKRFSCGVYMSYFVLRALANANEYQLIYDLIVSTDEHSWGNMLKEGATTCFEAWGVDQKWNTSLCHPWASSPVIIILEEIAGIKPKVPGYTKIDFNPHFPKELEHFKLDIKLPVGIVRVVKENGKVELKVIDNKQ